MDSEDAGYDDIDANLRQWEIAMSPDDRRVVEIGEKRTFFLISGLRALSKAGI